VVAHREKICSGVFGLPQYIDRSTKTVNTVLGIDDTTVYLVIPKESGHYGFESTTAGAADYIANKADSQSNTPILFILSKYSK
jgi:hypothetical protein